MSEDSFETGFDFEPSAKNRWSDRRADIDFEGDPVDLMRVDPDNLEFELSVIAAIVAYYSEQFGKAAERVLRAKQEVERVEAQQYLTNREILSAKARSVHKASDPKDRGTLKLPTDKMLDAAVKCSESYQTAKTALVEAEIDQVYLKGRCSAAREKAEALKAIGLKRNMEAKALMSVGMVKYW